MLLADKDGEALAAAAAEVRATGRRGEQVVVDLRDGGAAEVLVAAAVNVLVLLDIAVNNVGMLADRPASLVVDGDDESFRATSWSRTCSSPRARCPHEARRMIDQGDGGVIVNVSSGESVRPALTLAPYGAAKAAINHLTQTARRWSWVPTGSV